MQRVTQESDEVEEEGEEISIMDLISVMNLFFGFLDGMLNALPEGSQLGDCASDLESMRTRFTTMYTFINQDRDLSNAVNEAYIALKYTNAVSVNCYQGSIVFVDPEELSAAYDSFSFLENAMFNAGFIYTDLLMLLVGYTNKYTPSGDENYYYYMSFYTGDLIFRFIFMADTADVGNCWYEWVECETDTTVSVEEDSS